MSCADKIPSDLAKMLAEAERRLYSPHISRDEILVILPEDVRRNLAELDQAEKRLRALQERYKSEGADCTSAPARKGWRQPRKRRRSP
jgi:hypothetical protein